MSGDLVPVEGGSVTVEPGQADELADIRGLMRNKGSEYYRGPRAASIQARYRALIDGTAVGTRPTSPPVAVDASRELDDLRDMQRNPHSDYYKGPRSAKLQARYRQLLVEVGEAQPEIGDVLAEHEHQARGMLTGFEADLSGMGADVQRAVVETLGLPVTPVSLGPDEVAQLRRSPVGEILGRLWGQKFGQNMGIAQRRLDVILGRLGPEDGEAVERYLAHSEPTEQAAMMAILAGEG